MTPNAAAFIAATAESPVIAGAVIGNGGRGARYRLADGRTFKLSAKECGQVAPVRWQAVDPAADEGQPT